MWFFFNLSVEVLSWGLVVVLNQRTSGPVNTHLIPGIYSNTFILIHVYNPRAGAGHPLGTTFGIQKKFLVTLHNNCKFIFDV